MLKFKRKICDAPIRLYKSSYELFTDTVTLQSNGKVYLRFTFTEDGAEVLESQHEDPDMLFHEWINTYNTCGDCDPGSVQEILA